MLLDAPMPTATSSPEDVRIRILDADDPALPYAGAVAEVGFRTGGVAIGEEGTQERDDAAAGQSVEGTAFRRERIRKGYTVMAVAEDASGPIGIGSYQPIDEVAEIVGVATLPIARRRGVGAAITAALVEDARNRRGVEVVFLTAASTDVARIYGRVGFGQIATACIAGA